jgi:hypothetical protein
MKDIIVILPGKNHDFRISIPAHHLGEILSPPQVNALVTFENLLLDALLHPIGCQPLTELAKPGKKNLDYCRRQHPYHAHASGDSDPACAPG